MASDLDHKLSRMATIYGVGIAIVAAASLVLGCALHVVLFERIIASLPPIKPASALALCLLGLALALRERRALSRLLGVLVATLAAALAYEHVSGVDLRIDRLFSDSEAHVSIASTAALALGAASIMVLGVARARGAAAYLALAAGAVGLVRVVALLFGVDSVTGVAASCNDMSLVSAILMVLFSQGVGAAEPNTGLTALLTDGGATGKLAQRALLGVTSVPIAIGFLILRGESAGLWDAHYGTVLFASSNLVVLAALTWWVAAKLLHAEVAQREREQWLATTLASIGDAVIATDNNARVVRMNPVAASLTGWSESDAIGKPLDDVFHIISEDKRAKVESPAVRVLHDGVIVGLANHTLLVAKDGTERPIADSGAPIRDASGKVHGVVLVFRDQTESHRNELVLRASDQRFRRISESGIVGVVVSDGDRVLEANDTFLRAVGRARTDVDSGTLLLRDVVAGEARADEALEIELVRADGGKTPVLATSAMFDEQRSLSLYVDLSAQKRAQAENSASQSTVASLEAQLQQAQKMEAIGSLAGGVAHDFNNLLTVVLSYSEIVLSTLAHDDPSYRDVEEIRKAGHRAASLTRQLLAFSRRQILQPHVVDLNGVVDGMMKMLERLLPESIELSFRTRAQDSAVNVDAGQFEQVLLNLVVNARDAMPSGGTIAVATERVEVDQRGIADRLELEPGAYVVLRVSDSGSGMDAATQSRIFEPFFTTKDKSKGTGLGLSVVFGIVRQSGGAIWVYSEVGKGTTFKVYLPHSHVSPREDAERHAAPRGGSETLLLVEDEETVRRLASRILRRAGYEVLEAGDGADALAQCEKHGGAIHLLLSDVVMPRMSGRELHERLLPMRPGIKVLFMSGFTDDAVVQHGVREANVAFLQKPLLPDSLLQKVREVLG